MSSGTIEAIQEAVAPSWSRHRITNDEYHWLIESGFFGRFGLRRAFLWDGEIVESMAEDNPHLTIVMLLVHLLMSRFPRTHWTVHANQPVDLGRGYCPQPDLAVLRGSLRSWTERGRITRPGDVALLIEVSDSTYPTDVDVKLPKYAGSGVPLCWVVNVPGLVVEVYSDPDAEASRYRTRTVYGPNAIIPLTMTLEGAAFAVEGIPVREILGELLPE